MDEEDPTPNNALWKNKINSQSYSVPSPPLPRTIMDGSPSTVHRADLFFSTPPAVSQNRPLSRRSYSAGKPRSPSNLNRSRTAPSQNQPDKFVPPPPPPPLIIGSQIKPESPVDELHTVVQLSKSEFERQELFAKKPNSQEEDDLARALAESMRTSQTSPSLSSPGAGPSRPPPVPIHTRPYSQSLPSPPRRSCESRKSVTADGAVTTTGNRLNSPEIGDHSELAVWSSPPQDGTLLLDDEALARQLAAEEEREEERWRESARTSGENTQPSLEDDEAFARQLALQEEEEDKHEVLTPATANTTPPLPPAYVDAVSSPPSRTNSSLLRSDSSSSTSIISSPESLPSRSLQPMRSGSDEVLINEKSRHSVPSASLPSLNEQLETEHNMGAINVNQFVDKELLRGVSIGFYDPVVRDEAQPMGSVMPNIITLPYGKSPPLHLQATSWRHLLKLMARLSGTRIEPTAQATQRNEDLYLRTVIQFVRPHYTSLTWRTVVWFTIDQDAERPHFRRIGDVDSLPHSYSQMKLPALLRDSSDSPISKTYIIPSTHSVPYPVLPISFPNLTLYLQAALDESRRYFHDSSSGMRKFAKMLEHCYPDEFDSGAGATERSRVTGLFKKVIGRGGKSSKKGRGGNEETYDLVTPFVPDEWG